MVVSCRIRLARNIEGFSFVSRLESDQATELCERLRGILDSQAIDGETIWVEIPDAPVVLRLCLRERHLASRDLAPSSGTPSEQLGRAVAFGETETTSVMVNEEDHLRLQGFSAGFDPDLAWQRVHDLDRALEDKVEFSFTRKLGYLTGCPTNVGTGMRASVMLHLPCLGMVRSELEKVFAAAQRTGLAVRGMYGEGSRAAGDFYQVSNQVTLGRTESQLIGDLKALVPAIVQYERRVRELLQEEQPTALRDRVMRSYGMLRTARAMPTEVALSHLSNVRLGSCLGLLEGVESGPVTQLAVQIQKGHVQALSEDKFDSPLLDASERDRLRASLLRQRFGQ